MRTATWEAIEDALLALGVDETIIARLWDNLYDPS